MFLTDPCFLGIVLISNWLNGIYLIVNPIALKLVCDYCSFNIDEHVNRLCTGAGDGNWGLGSNTYGWFQRSVMLFPSPSSIPIIMAIIILICLFCHFWHVMRLRFVTEIHSSESGLATSNRCFQIKLSPQVHIIILQCGLFDFFFPNFFWWLGVPLHAR